MAFECLLSLYLIVKENINFLKSSIQIEKAKESSIDTWVKNNIIKLEEFVFVDKVFFQASIV